MDVIDVDTRSQVAPVPVGTRPRGLGFSPDGRRAFVAAEASSEIYVIDTQSFTVQSRLKAGPKSNGISVHPDGRRVF
ncbi:hypothetical protein ABTK83_19500, partial [Acinetobacter baumannii]